MDVLKTEDQTTASTVVTDPPHWVDPPAEDCGRQTERCLVPAEDSKAPADDDFGDFQEEDEDFGDFEAAQKEVPPEVLCDRLQRPLAPLSKVKATTVECAEPRHCPTRPNQSAALRFSSRP